MELELASDHTTSNTLDMHDHHEEFMWLDANARIINRSTMNGGRRKFFCPSYRHSTFAKNVTMLLYKYNSYVAALDVLQVVLIVQYSCGVTSTITILIRVLGVAMNTCSIIYIMITSWLYL
jgi:hypothetical protein